MVHGDEFIGVGPDKHLGELKAVLEQMCRLKAECLGCGEGEGSERLILNEMVGMTNAGVELEADPLRAFVPWTDVIEQWQMPCCAHGQIGNADSAECGVVV